MKKVFFLAFLIFIVQTIKSQVVNQSAQFSGTAGSNASFGDINELDGVNKFSFEAWVYINSWNVNSYIFSKTAATLPAQNRIDIQLGQVATKRLYFHVANNGNSYLQLDNPAIAVGQWNHIVMAYDGTKTAYNMIRVYINGTQVTTGLSYSTGNGTLPSITPDTTGAFEIGKNFNGKIDEVKLWNCAITASDLDMHNTVNNYQPAYDRLISYWKLDKAGTSILDTKDKYPGILMGATTVPVTDNNAFKYKIVSSYVRSNFYESNQISPEYLRNNNDIIYLAANPYANGDLFFEYPVNNGILTNANYVATFASRNGVIDFTGAGSSMNCGGDLLNKASGGITTFSFSSWIYIDKWNENSCIFRKYESSTKNINLELGAAASNQLIFRFSNGADNYVTADNSGISTGGWHHVGVTYAGNAAAFQQVKIYVDGIVVPVTYKNGNGLIAASGPFIRSDFELGVGFDGKFDESVLSLLSFTSAEMTSIKNNPIVVDTWNETKTCAYWKFDDASKPGKDSRTWVGVLNGLKQTFDGYDGAQIRLGLSGGDWKAMITTSSARANFAAKIKNLIETYGFDGVDLDFEWCLTNQEWADYSAAILALDDVLSPAANFTVTLHPLYYKISAAAIAAVDYISIQSYGPSPDRFPYSEFVSNISSMLSYGYPPQKLIMGLPFFGTASDNSKVTASYRAAVSQNPSLDPALDLISMNVPPVKTMTFNGQQTIIKKTKYTREQDLAGVMYWDTATDVDYNNQLCLLGALNTILNANVQKNTSEATLSVLPSQENVSKSDSNPVSIFSTYPNPATNTFTIEFQTGVQGCIELYSIEGRLLFTQSLDNQKKISINGSRLGAGVYIVKYLSLSGQSQSTKLIIK